MKLIFKSMEQDPDFTKALIKMTEFHIFSTRRYSNMAILKRVDEGVPDCKCTMYN